MSENIIITVHRISCLQIYCAGLVLLC